MLIFVTQTTKTLFSLQSCCTMECPHCHAVLSVHRIKRHFHAWPDCKLAREQKMNMVGACSLLRKRKKCPAEQEEKLCQFCWALDESKRQHCREESSDAEMRTRFEHDGANHKADFNFLSGGEQHSTSSKDEEHETSCGTDQQRQQPCGVW